MRGKIFGGLVEARIREAQARGALDNLAGEGKPLPKDPLEGLPHDQRIEALIQRAAGAAPEEVELIRDIAALRERREAATDPAEKERLGKELSKKSTRLRILFEASGRHVLVNSVLTSTK